MSNQPTPETDAAAWVETNQANALVLASFACNLERQRDAAISRFESSQSARMELKRERDEARELARELRDALEAVMPYIVGDRIVPWKAAETALTKAKEVLP
jgi:hypothetical protein